VNLLAIETATEACSAALLVNDEVIQRYELAPREHAKRILVMVDELMAEAGIGSNQLDALAFGRGPGSFIGVRIAAGVAQGIAYSADLPVVPVSTLAAIAQGSGSDHVLVAIDARMGEIYWGKFERATDTKLVTACDAEQLVRPDKVAEFLQTQDHQWVGVGSGWQTYQDILTQQLPTVTVDQDHQFPTAQLVVQLATASVKAGDTVSAEQAVPVYLRDKVAVKPKK